VPPRGFGSVAPSGRRHARTTIGRGPPSGRRCGGPRRASRFGRPRPGARDPSPVDLDAAHALGLGGRDVLPAPVGAPDLQARPDLTSGSTSGFAFDNASLSIGARADATRPSGRHDALRMGVRHHGAPRRLGRAGAPDPLLGHHPLLPRPRHGARVVHFFFAWTLVGTLAVWLVAASSRAPAAAGPDGGGPARPAPRRGRARAARLTHGRGYGPLQKLSYAGVMFVLLPLMELTGLASRPRSTRRRPGCWTSWGGGTARTLHFLVMLLLVGFSGPRPDGCCSRAPSTRCAP
jgi:hypothetical protein